MNRGNLKTYGLARCAGLKAATVGTNLMDIMIQNSANDVAFRTLVMKENSMFSAIAGTARYNTSTVVSNFVAIDKPGLWWKTGGEWKELKPKTMSWIKENRKNWLNEDPGDPEYFIEDGNEILLVPAPVDALSDGFLLFFCQKAHTMTDDTQYPFYGSSEIAKLTCLDESIIAHFRWKGLGITGQSDDYNLAQREYEAEIEKAKGLLLRNLALQNSPYNVMRGRLIR